jgi:hypothetical protein
MDYGLDALIEEVKECDVNLFANYWCKSKKEKLQEGRACNQTAK